LPPLNPYEQFWTDWFGLVGREVGNPYRSFCPGRVAFLQFVDRCYSSRAPCYLSVNPYRARDRVAGLEKLFFDFDCAENPDRAFAEATDFARQLETHYHVAPLLVFSGRKGYHVYAYLWNTVTFNAAREAFAKAVYRRVANLLLEPRPRHQPGRATHRLQRGPVGRSRVPRLSTLTPLIPLPFFLSAHPLSRDRVRVLHLIQRGRRIAPEHVRGSRR
jgi:hypothetical protein